MEQGIENATQGKIYLIPTPISEGTAENVLPANLLKFVKEAEEFITENIKTTRRYLRSIGFKGDFDQIPYHLINKHTSENELPGFLKGAEKGKTIALFSEAGMPCIADPGALVVKIAHQKNIKVVPVNGPSSIMLALAASGFNGQNFAFNGYLPIQSAERTKQIKKYEARVKSENQTQIFIEAPYRNNQLLDAFIKTCEPNTLLCVASEITAEHEFIKTLPVKAWQKEKPNLHKKNTIFLIYK